MVVNLSYSGDILTPCLILYVLVLGTAGVAIAFRNMAREGGEE